MGNLEDFIKDRKAVNVSHFRALPVEAERALKVGDDNIIEGYAIVWNSINSYREQLVKGATAVSISARGVGSTKNPILVLSRHNTALPIAKLIELREDDYGLYFKAELVNTDAGRQAKEEINAGVLSQLSYGFNYIWDRTEYDEESDSYILREIKLIEISLVTFSADDNAQLRDFGEYQKNQIINSFDLRQLEELQNIFTSKLQNRDEHSEVFEEVEKSNVNIF